MPNSPVQQHLTFDTELSLSAPFSGTPQLIGTLTNNPVILLVKNQSTVPVFIADNAGSTKGTTMVAGEEFILDCRANKGNAVNLGFFEGTAFFCTGTGGIGAVKIGVLYVDR